MRYSICDIRKLKSYIRCLKRYDKKKVIDDIWRVELVRAQAELKALKQQLKDELAKNNFT